MTINSSGPISIYSATAAQSIETELQYSQGSTISFNDILFRYIANGNGVAGPVSVSNTLGKSIQLPGTVFFYGNNGSTGQSGSQVFQCLDSHGPTYTIYACGGGGGGASSSTGIGGNAVFRTITFANPGTTSNGASNYLVMHVGVPCAIGANRSSATYINDSVICYLNNTSGYSVSTLNQFSGAQLFGNFTRVLLAQGGNAASGSTNGTDEATIQTTGSYNGSSMGTLSPGVGLSDQTFYHGSLLSASGGYGAGGQGNSAGQAGVVFIQHN